MNENFLVRWFSSRLPRRQRNDSRLFAPGAMLLKLFIGRALELLQVLELRVQYAMHETIAVRQETLCHVLVATTFGGVFLIAQTLDLLRLRFR